MSVKVLFVSVSLALVGVLLLAITANAVPQISGPAGTVRWTEGAPNATSEVKNDTKIEGLKTDDIHIFVSLADLKETEYNRVWVQVSNHSKAPVDFDPQSAILLTSKDKTAHAEVPDKAAKAIQKFGEAKSQELSSAHCNMMAAVQCQPTNTQMQMSKQVAAFSGQQAQWVRDNALTKKTLAPGEQAQGVIVFKKDKKRADYILRCPVGSQLFEFPVSAQNKASSYD
jgi:hypothetical protein